MKQLVQALAAALLLLFVSCERDSQEIGGKGVVKRAQDEGAGPAVYAVPAAVNVKEVAPQGKEGEINGALLFATHCASCHQATGEGLPGIYPPLAKSPYVLSNKTDRLAAIMLYGLSGPIRVLGNDYNNLMTPLGAVLKDEELAAIATFVRSSWSNMASPVEASVFAEARKRWGSRGPFSISELGEE